MPNSLLPESRQRWGNMVTVSGYAIGLLGLPVAAWTGVEPLLFMGIGIALVFIGAGIVTKIVVCPKCSRRCVIIGRPTRMHCAYCGADYYRDEPDAPSAPR